MDRLQIPPIRTRLDEVNGAQPGPTGRTAKEWYLHWQRATELVNDHTDTIAELDTALEALTEELADTIRSGMHADRLDAEPNPLGAFWIETDRNNIVYQAQEVAGTPAWVYVTGAMFGTIIAVDQRPAGLGVNDKGLFFLSSDSTSVRWSGSSWQAIGSRFDIGAAPVVSQLVVKANGQGGFSVLAYSPDNVQIGFDVEADLAGVGWKALATSCAWISKVGAVLQVNGVSGATVGAGTGQILMGSVDLATGRWTFPQRITVQTDGFYFGANRVVGARMAAVTPPAGGTTIDTQARTAIQSILNVLSAAAGGHGLTA